VRKVAAAILAAMQREHASEMQRFALAAQQAANEPAGFVDLVARWASDVQRTMQEDRATRTG
jgi:hypothetical protein